MSSRLYLDDVLVQVPDPAVRGRWETAVGPISVDADGPTIVVTGPSGAGKSLLVGALAGLVPAGTRIGGQAHATPDGGQPVRLVGPHRPRGVLGSQVALIAQHDGFGATRTLRSQLADSPTVDVGEVARWLDRFEISPHVVSRRPGTLSGGQQQAVVVAAALATGAPVVLADEPTAGLDARRTGLVAAALVDHAHHGGLVLVTTHDPAVADVVGGTRLRLDGGRLCPTSG